MLVNTNDCTQVTSDHDDQQNGNSTRKYFTRGRRSTKSERANVITAAVVRMENYVMPMLRKSGGAPVSVNQSAMEKAFRKLDKAGKPCGPSRSTVTRHWTQFMGTMIAKGFRFRRYHGAGVGLIGKRVPHGTRTSKLVWMIYSTAWERSGGEIMHYVPSVRDGRLRSRWVRDEKRSLVPVPLIRRSTAIHCLKSAPTPDLLPCREQKEFQKQSTQGVTGQHAVARRISCDPKPSKPPSKLTWRTPKAVLRGLWGVGRGCLRSDAGPLVRRAIYLWRAGFPAKTLFRSVWQAGSWAHDADTGHRGKIAAAVLANLVMRPSASDHSRPPTNTEFWLWVNANTPAWRAAAATRAREWREQQTREFLDSLGINREELRRRIEASLRT